VDVIRFLALRHGFLLLMSRKMSYICIELNLSRTNLMLQLNISHGLADVVVVDRF
jgi:hypothetical protein